ncbi:MAG TPA: mannose-1-phosphate guanyltransferase [Acidimicrobiia bacterium]|nr:mannose-1-phosphate guanyltransferase [Acidimicrobiia bacterium]
MKAVIMAGGEGTRLRPLTSNQPKPMIPVVNRPMMEHIIRLLVRHGFDEIVVTVAYLANHIRNYFGDGSEFGVELRYALEEEPLGTAGSVRNAAAQLDDTFLVISGDVLTDVDLTEIWKAHREKGATATIALKRVENPLEFGIVITHEDGSIERFLEKPGWGQVFSDTVNTGIYVLEPEVFDYIDAGRPVDFSGEVFPAMLEAGRPMYGHVAEGYWEDVGTPEAYLQAHRDILSGAVSIDVPGFMIREGVWLGEGADVDPDAVVEGPCVIGDNCRIEAGARLGEYVVLGSDVIVRHDAFLERSLVHDHSYLGPATRLRGCSVGRSCDLRHGARIEEGVVLGDECFVGEHAVINPGLKVYPFKTIEDDAVVNASIVWESRGARSLFGRRGVRGLANVDIGPELGVRLAVAYGSTLKKGSVVTMSRDSSRTARALKRVMQGALNLSGISVDDLELAPVPLTRFQVRNDRAQGGITVRLAAGDPQSLEIRFFDSEGRDLDEPAQRKIERQLAREDFRRAFAAEIGDIVFPPRAVEFYTSALQRTLDTERIRERRFKAVLDYSFGATSMVLPTVLSKLGAEILAVNPYASTATAVLTGDEVERRAQRIGELVRTSGSHLGCVLDPDGETLLLVDDEGTPLTPDQALLAVISLVTSVRPGARVAVPVSASQAAEDIARANGGEVVWTTLSAAGLMEEVTSGQIDFAASRDGGYVWPDFLPAFDAIMAFAKVMDMLAATGQRLSEVVRRLPSVHVAEEAVPTPWEQKGTVMRNMVERSKDREVVLVDGVKVIYPNGWVLVAPDAEEPLTRVWAEGASDHEARQLAQEHARRIRSMLR